MTSQKNLKPKKLIRNEQNVKEANHEIIEYKKESNGTKFHSKVSRANQIY